MRKSNISVDFIAFGDLDPANTRKLEAFHENIKSAEGCHLEVIPPGPHLLSDLIRSTPILDHDGSAPRNDDIGGGGDSGGAGFEFGDDPNNDPELALALRMSMEEEKARQDKEMKAMESAAAKESLSGIPEEGSESQPLLDQHGEASGSGGKIKEERDDEDKMDTA
jgi:26S proteasome regulatory subunit N10